MKNIIAITALLAAGTALANAEEWDVIKYWDGFSSSDYTPLYSAESDVSLSDSSLVLAANGRAVFDVSSYSINFSTNTYQFELELTDWTTATSGPTIAWGISNTNDTNGQLMAFGGRGTSVWGTSSNGSNMSGGDGNSLGTYQNLTGTLTITIGEGAIAVKFVDSSSIERSLINERSFTCSTTDVAQIVLGGWASTPNNGSTMTVSSMKISQVIPEPSAFGLLAGVGALAFVASRRRRSRK